MDLKNYLYNSAIRNPIQGIQMYLQKPREIIQTNMNAYEYFPGNPRFPLLIYKNVISQIPVSAQDTQTLLQQNNWGSSWIDSIYDFHHYHSNTHEVLVIISGTCLVQFGGEKGPKYTVTPGDVVIIPAGVAHKSIEMSDDFQCIGAYPFDIEFDMNYGTQEEYDEAVQSIKKVALPAKDPVLGEQGLMFDYWKM